MFDWLASLFDEGVNLIGEITAIISILLLIILFFIFDFKFIIRANKMIIALFRELNIPYLLANFLPWKLKKLDTNSKKEKYKYLKGFCEYAIFASKGQKLSKTQWTALIQDYFFENVISSAFKISLDSSFDILDSNVDHCIKKYFDFLNKNYKKYFHDKKYSKFESNLIFENGYVYPSSFINGLEKKFQDSWTSLLVKYNFTLKNSKYQNSKTRSSIIKSMKEDIDQHFIISNNNAPLKIENNELFMIYSWLMWSPSYQIKFSDDSYKIILYGIGDESNTVNLILDNTQNAMDLWFKLKQVMEKNVFGINLSIECELHEFLPYIRENTSNFSMETLPLINNLLNNSNDIRYILSYVAPTSDSSLRSTVLVEDNDAFFSGYLWALFAKNIGKETKFEIKNSVAFFEHTNLADSSSVDYFTKAMAQKTLLHFKSIFEQNKHCYYSLAFCVADSFKEEYVKLINEELMKYDREFQKNFAKYVSLENNYITDNEILENIDEEFPLNEFEFKQVNSAGEIGKFYAELYVKNFDEDERDSIDDLIYRTVQLKSENHHDIILAYQKDDIVGGVIFDWFKKSNCGIIEYIVVDNKFRGMRIGQKLVAKAIAQITNYGKKDNLNAIFIEVEDPNKMENLDKEASINNYKRLQLWSNNKFAKLDFNYVQPALSEGLNELDNLMLAVNTIKPNDGYIDAKVLKEFLIEFNEISNRIENVYDEKLGIKKMLDEIESKKDGKIKIIKDYLMNELQKSKNSIKKEKK